MDFQERHRISRSTRDLMVGYAICIDILGALANAFFGFGSTVVNWTLGYPVLWMWFASKKVYLFKSNKIRKNFIINGIVGFIPFINIYPDITVFALRSCVLSRREDREYNDKKAAQTEATLLKLRREQQKAMYREQAMNQLN